MKEDRGYDLLAMHLVAKTVEKAQGLAFIQTAKGRRGQSRSVPDEEAWKYMHSGNFQAWCEFLDLDVEVVIRKVKERRDAR